jgi:hypothetical protein
VAGFVYVAAPAALSAPAPDAVCPIFCSTTLHAASGTASGPRWGNPHPPVTLRCASRGGHVEGIKKLRAVWTARRGEMFRTAEDVGRRT